LENLYVLQGPVIGNENIYLTNAVSKPLKASLKGCIQLGAAFLHGRNPLFQITLCARGVRRRGRYLFFRKIQLWIVKDAAIGRVNLEQASREILGLLDGSLSLGVDQFAVEAGFLKNSKGTDNPHRRPAPLPSTRNASLKTLPDTEFDQIPRQVRFLLRKAKALQINLAELTQGRNPAARLITRDLRFPDTVSENASALKGVPPRFHRTFACGTTPGLAGAPAAREKRTQRPAA
jgi:hypothetical protein